MSIKFIIIIVITVIKPVSILIFNFLDALELSPVVSNHSVVSYSDTMCIILQHLVNQTDQL